MKTFELIEQLQKLPQDLEVVLCNLEDDGCGDGLANLHDIVDVSQEMAVNNGKKVSAVFITYRDYNAL